MTKFWFSIFNPKYWQLCTFFDRDRKGGLSVAVVRGLGKKFQNFVNTISLLCLLELLYKVRKVFDEKCRRRSIFKINFLVFEIIAIKVRARNQNDLKAGFQIAISLARINIFTCGKKFLKDLTEIFVKHIKPHFSKIWPQDPLAPLTYNTIPRG